MEELLRRSNVIIHYVTSDPNDQIFELAKKESQIRPYYIGEKKLITLMMKMDADIVVMTVPDLDNLYLKRSYVKKDIEYIYMVHYGIGSSNLLLRKLALAHYDTIYCAGPQQEAELRAEEKMYNLPRRRLVPCGYSLFDRIIAEYTRRPQVKHEKPQILIAPSWQKDNILDSCIDRLLESLMGERFLVILRPHPEYVKRYPQRWAELQMRWSEKQTNGVEFQSDFSSNDTVFKSDLLITDWSTISYEFAFAAKRPVLFVDTPLKAMNPEWSRLGIEPLDITIRDEIGRRLKPEETDQAGKLAAAMLKEQNSWRERIVQTLEKNLYNPGKSARAECDYILHTLMQKQVKKKAVSEL